MAKAKARNVRVRVGSVDRSNPLVTVVELSPVLAWEVGKRYKLNEYPAAHGGHDIHHSHRWTVSFDVGMMVGGEPMVDGIVAAKVAELTPGCEYDVAEPITAESKFTPVNHEAVG